MGGNRIRGLSTRSLHGLLPSLVLCVGIFLPHALASALAAEPDSDATIDFDGRKAYRHLLTICRIGPRVSGSQGMIKQQRLLIDHFTELGGQVKLQTFDAPHPATGRPVRLANLIVQWHPQAEQRVLLCCHYDTRPFPDRDPIPANRTKPFIGANDGASGVAALMELGRHIPKLDLSYGVDFVFFDAEELVYRSSDPYFLGSEYFAQQYRDKPPNYWYVAGVLLDMVADRNQQFYYEKNSLRYAPEVTRSIWRAAKRANVPSFVARAKHEVRDDHLPLNRIAEIPTCDIIDFDYPYWHTTADVPSNCSSRSLTSVGTVIVAWLRREAEQFTVQ